jgi:hypothetical protein
MKRTAATRWQIPQNIGGAIERPLLMSFFYGSIAMADTTFARESVTVVEAGPYDTVNWSGIGWSGVIAGALTAIAVTAIIVALGSGIGFSLASPFSSSPSGSTLTIMGAVWLVFAQAVGFATGGYMAGRLRANPGRWHTGEVKFRDAANGLVVWAIGVVLSMLLLASAVSKITSAAGTAATAGNAAATAGATAGVTQPSSLDYYTDKLLRTNPQSQTSAAGNSAPNNGGAAANAMSQMQRQQVGLIMLNAIGPNGLSNDDRTYLAQIVSAQSGISEDDAQKKVDDVVNQAKAEATKAADTARKGAEYFAFWTFMSLLFGAVCAALGGMLGGDLRDEFAVQRVIPTAPR